MSSACYWEKQGQDKLCAVHALNALVQGPVFDEFTLASIARDLDREEQALINDGSTTASANGNGNTMRMGNFNQKSDNVDWDGNFSLPVMERALQQIKLEGSQGARIGGSGVEKSNASGTVSSLTLVNLDRPDVRSQVLQDINSEDAYLCNSHRRAHWYTLRKIQGLGWFDLDSLKGSPNKIQDYDMGMMIQQIMSEGFTVFVIRQASPHGPQKLQQQLPPPDKFLRPTKRDNQYYLTPSEAEELAKKAAAAEAQEMRDADAKFGGGGGDKSSGDGGKAPAFTMVVPADKRKIETDWSKLGQGQSLSAGSGSGAGGPGPNGGQGQGNGNNMVVDEEMDDDLKAAILASLNDVKVKESWAKDIKEPEAGSGKGIVTVIIRFKNDDPLKRRFDSNVNTMGDICDFLEWATLKHPCRPLESIGSTPLVSMTYSLLKAGFPKKEKFIRPGGGEVESKRVYLLMGDGSQKDVTDDTLKIRDFEREEKLILQME